MAIGFSHGIPGLRTNTGMIVAHKITLTVSLHPSVKGYVDKKNEPENPTRLKIKISSSD
jgi:hypothetical protein|tara:strand:- start:227 stop:403 length:177 start_codon:yes stop_codon:yes gene_type:complete